MCDSMAWKRVRWAPSPLWGEGWGEGGQVSRLAPNPVAERRLDLSNFICSADSDKFDFLLGGTRRGGRLSRSVPPHPNPLGGFAAPRGEREPTERADTSSAQIGQRQPR